MCEVPGIKEFGVRCEQPEPASCSIRRDAVAGPVISRPPSAEGAGELWDHVVGLTRFAGFTELKRSLREQPQLRGLGVDPDAVGVQEDWRGGSRRQQK